MENAGALALILALCLAVYASVISLIAEWKAKPMLALSAERAAYAVWALLTTASGILIYALLQSDFRLAYVFSTSNRELPAIYKFTAWWGGQEGSLLLWSWLLPRLHGRNRLSESAQAQETGTYVIFVSMTTEGVLRQSDLLRRKSLRGMAARQAGLCPARRGGLDPSLCSTGRW